MPGKDLRNRNVLSRWRKTGEEGDDGMSRGKEFQRTDAATRNDIVIIVVNLFVEK